MRAREDLACARAILRASVSRRDPAFGAFHTYSTTEFLRFRLGFEHTESDVASLDGLSSGFLELNFVYGSHPSEPCWVNR